MKTKSKKITLPKTKKDPFKDKPSVIVAEYGHKLSSLLWQKVLANSTPEIQEAILVQNHLASIWDRMAPSDLYRVPKPELTHERLLQEIDKAEYLLTGAKGGSAIGLPDGYENNKPSKPLQQDSIEDG